LRAKEEWKRGYDKIKKPCLALLHNSNVFEANHEEDATEVLPVQST